MIFYIFPKTNFDIHVISIKWGNYVNRHGLSKEQTFVKGGKYFLGELKNTWKFKYQGIHGWYKTENIKLPNNFVQTK